MHENVFALSIDETRSSLRKLNLVENYEADYSTDFTAKEVEKVPPVEGDQNGLKISIVPISIPKTAFHLRVLVICT